MNIQAKNTLTMKKQKHNRRSNLLLFEQVLTVRHAIGDGNLVKSHKLRNYLKPLNDVTKILTETYTETFFTILNFPKPKPRLFSETKFF